MAKLTENERGFRQGVAITIANMNRLHDCPVVAKNTFESMGYSLKQLEQAGVDEYDLKELRSIFR